MASVLQSSCFSRFAFARFFICFFWVLGLFTGIAIFLNHSDIFVSLMRGFSFSSVSIVWVFLAVFFPYLLTAFAVYFSTPWILVCFSFLKGIFFSLISMIVICTFHGGWLIRFLLMFYEIFSIPVLYACWNRGFFSNFSGFFAECLGWMIFSFLLAGIHYRFISPFVSGLGIL